jgi:hypothetical protein
METKPLLYGLIGFILGGLLVSTAAVSFDRNDPALNPAEHQVMQGK